MNKPKLVLKIEREAVELILTQEGQAIDQEQWPEARRLGLDLLPALDRLLERNQLIPALIESLNIQSQLPESAMARRIGEVAAIMFVLDKTAK